LARDPYQELGVGRTASADEIRKAFRKLAKANHPDTNPGDKAAEERFKKVSAAFDIVGDAEKRKKFDRGEIDADGRETAPGFAGWGGGGPGGGFGGQGGPRGGFRTDTFEGADLGDILGEATGGGRRGFAFRAGRTIAGPTPRGARDGETRGLRGQGQPGRSGRGDAFIEIALKPHPTFRREGDALVMDLPITFYDAVLGGKVEAPTPDGPVNVTVPKGANSGARLRLKGRGLVDAKGHRGDLFARLVVTLPEGADPELEAFAEQQKSKRPYTPKRR